MKQKLKRGARAFLASSVALALAACGGGGGGHRSSGSSPAGSGGTGGSSNALYYPYEDVYGTVCATMEATPGCTFSRSTGLRITVSSDPHYDRFANGSDDLWFVEFDDAGVASVYNDLGVFQYYADVSTFAGWVGGTEIGVGTTGLFWEDVRNGTYWLGKNGVLFNGMAGESNFGQAINDRTASSASDTNFAAMNSETNKILVKKGAEKLMKEYGFKKDKATAVASALNSWAVAASERGKTSTKDMDKTFKAVFGVQFADALSAVKDLAVGDTASMQDLTQRSAAALGLKPHQAQKFMKGMYKKALSQWGFDVETINW